MKLFPQTDCLYPVDPLDNISVTTLKRFLLAGEVHLRPAGSWSDLDKFFDYVGSKRSELVAFAALTSEDR